MTTKALLKRLIADEAGSTGAELALFVALAMTAGAGFFCFTAGQFRQTFESSYSIR